MILEQWAMQWGIPFEALNDFRQRVGMLLFDPSANNSALSEGGIQAKVRLSASAKGVRLFRNNVGAGYLQDGSFIRWGLCNDSAALNKKVKSSDLIGIRPVMISPDHVGKVMGQFVAREVKKPGWVFTGTDREVAQFNFIALILGFGGDAQFTTSPDGDL